MLLKTISYISIVVALSIAIIKHKQIKTTTEKYFIYYLLFVVLNEAMQIILFNKYKLFTYASYNLYDIVSFMFFITWYYTILEHKKIVKYIGLCYIIILFISLCVEDFFTEYLDINTYTGTITLLLLALMYFASLLKKDEVIYFTKEPKFWISIGILIFYIGYLPILFLISLNTIQTINVSILITILCVILYMCYSIGFLCYKTNIKPT